MEERTAFVVKERAVWCVNPRGWGKFRRGGELWRKNVFASNQRSLQFTFRND